MSAEDRAATPLSPEQFNAILRVVREAVRAEMRAEFEGRRPAADRDVTMLLDVSAEQKRRASRPYDVPPSIAGVPV